MCEGGKGGRRNGASCAVFLRGKDLTSARSCRRKEKENNIFKETIRCPLRKPGEASGLGGRTIAAVGNRFYEALPIRKRDYRGDLSTKYGKRDISALGKEKKNGDIL